MGSAFLSPYLRSRDLILFFKGDVYTATPSDEMLIQGWKGGQGVQWAPGYKDERTVTFSDGRYGGVVLWGSDEDADKFTGIFDQQRVGAFLVVAAGGNLISTATYERYTYASRIGGGPLVPIQYQPNDILYHSLQGLYTNEDEATLAGKPWAPNFFVGFVAQVPRADNGWYLGVQTSY